MAKPGDKTSDKADEALPDAQRLSLLEKGMNLNRMFLGLTALLVIVTLSVTITIAILTALQDDSAPELNSRVDNLVQKLEALERETDSTAKALRSMQDKLPELRQMVDSSNAPAFQKVLIAQEESFQNFLRGLKEGMYDLSRMVPGSRTWLEMYNEQMDAAVRESIERKRALQRIDTGQPLIEPGGPAEVPNPAPAPVNSN